MISTESKHNIDETWRKQLDENWLWQEDDPRISYHSRRAGIFPNKTRMDSIQ